MNPVTVNCVECHKCWQIMMGGSIYERQMLESRPCPNCGGFTLICAANADEQATRRILLSFRRQARAARLVNGSRPAA